MMAVFSYLSAALVFATVLLLTLFLWRGRLQGAWLILALTLMLVWAGYSALSNWIGELNPSNLVFLEMLRNGSWALLLWKLHSSSRGIHRDFWRDPKLWTFGAALLVFLLINLAQSAGLGFVQALPVDIRHLGPFLLSILVLILLEQWYRNIPSEQRWSIKFFCLAVAVIFGYDFLLYSEALLYGRVDPMLWDSRGWVYALVAPLIAVSIARSKDWNSALRFSHRFVFFSTGLLLAGLYLLLMSLVGYYLRWFGTGLGNAVQIIFVVFSLALLALLLVSGRFRSLVTVWATKHFFPYKYDYREEWIRANNRFASLPADQGYYEQLILGLAEPMDSVGGVIWVRDGDAFHVRGNWTLPPMPSLDATRDASLLDYAQSRSWVIELDEYRAFPERYRGLTLPDWLSGDPDIWLLVPLVHQSHCYGLVGLAEPRVERTINWEDYDLLKTLGAQLAALIALKNTTDSLTQSRQFEAYNRLSTFVVHDIKNVVAQLSLVVKNSQRHKHNPEFVDDALETLSHAVGRMNRMLGQLKQEHSAGARIELVNVRSVAAAVEQQQRGHLPHVTLQVEAPDLRLRINREKLISVLCHLVHNAQDATEDTGQVVLRVREEDGAACFEVSDTGCGMDSAFIRDQLFKPFHTTKGRAGMGIGVYEARQFVIENQGRITVDSAPGQGTVFRVLLPRHQKIEEKETTV